MNGSSKKIFVGHLNWKVVLDPATVQIKEENAFHSSKLHKPLSLMFIDTETYFDQVWLQVCFKVFAHP